LVSAEGVEEKKKNHARKGPSRRCRKGRLEAVASYHFPNKSGTSLLYSQREGHLLKRKKSGLAAWFGIRWRQPFKGFYGRNSISQCAQAVRR